MTKTLAIVSLSFCLLAGCGSGGGVHTESVTVDGITITTVQPPGEHIIKGETVGRDTKQKDMVTGLEYTLKNKELTVDGRSYGMLAHGDTVRIEAGNVMVNGGERTPK